MQAEIYLTRGLTIDVICLPSVELDIVYKGVEYQLGVDAFTDKETAIIKVEETRAKRILQHARRIEQLATKQIVINDLR